MGAGQFITWLEVTASKFYSWRERYGRVNEHNGWVPRDFWLEDRESISLVLVSAPALGQEPVKPASRT